MAAILLGSAGRAAAQEPIAKLTEGLRSGDEKARISAIDSLGRLGPAAKGAVGALAAQLGDKSPSVRAHAAQALESIGSAARAASPALIEAVSDPDAHVRRTAILALERIDSDPKLVSGVFSKALQDPEPAVRVAALSALTGLGEASVSALVEALANADTRYWAALALGELGPAAKGAVDGLTRALEDPRPEVRREALIALGRIGPAAAPAVGAVTAALADPEQSVRHGAAFALGRIGPPAAQAAGVLRQTMKTSDELMQTVSAWALARIEPMNQAAREQAIGLLIAALKNKNPRVQMAAFKGLSDLEPQPAQWVGALTQIMAGGDRSLVSETLGTLAALGDAATPVLIAALKRPEARWQSAMLLARLGPKAGAAVPALVGSLADEDPDVRREVLFALGSVGSEANSGEAAIVGLLEKDPDMRVRTGAAYALGRIGRPSQVAMSQLRKSLESPDPTVRVVSAWSLVQIAPKDSQVARDALPVLMQGLQNQNIAVRRGAAEALGALGPAGRSANKQLQAATRDPDESVRKAAAAALERTGGLIIKGDE